MRNRLVSRALEYDALYAAYVEALLTCVRLSGERPAEDPKGPPWLERPFTNDQFESSIEALVEFARERGAFVSDQIGRARR